MAKSQKSDYPNIDSGDPRQFKQLVQNVHTAYNQAPEHIRHTAPDWYPAVNDAVRKGIRGTSMTELGGAGVVAAVSPNMDWDNHNIDAFSELKHIKSAQWKDIANGDRSPLAGMSISRAGQGNLLKAHRIMQGEHVDTVLPRNSAPKTNSFAHNIALEDTHVTIDGRAHDMAANRMQPWEMDRGIGSAALKTGKPTRYEHFEDAYRGATQSINEEHGLNLKPFQVQSVNWESGKAFEKSTPTKTGKPRKVGIHRQGQPYV
jgi:hypothetical protein